MSSIQIFTIFLYFLFLFVISNIFANLADRSYFNKVQSGYLNFLTVVFCLFTLGLFTYIAFKVLGKNALYLFLYAVIVLFVICFMYIIYAYSYLSPALVLFLKYCVSFLTILILLVFLAIVANFWLQYFMRLFRGTVGEFILRFIFFLPCLLLDFFRYLLKDFQSTPYITPFLIFVEIVLILLYIYIPVLLDRISFKNFSVVRDEPFFIRNELYYGTEISTFKDIKIEKKAMFKILPRPDDKNRIYSFSMWMLIRQSNDSMKSNNGGEFPLFTYGDSSNNYRPQITYHTHTNGDVKDATDPFTDKIRINVSTAHYYDLYLAKQKWVNLVITYFDDRVEIYVNGNMVTSIPLKTVADKNVIITENYKAFLGSRKYAFGNFAPDVILCNVHLYETPLEHTDVANVYNMGKNTFPYPGAFT